MIKLHNQDSLELMPTLESGSIDIICIDPPYLYLKNQKLERPFDENLFFSEAKRLLTKDGFIVMFGRGESFYRWNTKLASLGFTFKEEIVWDKSYNTSPVLPINRVHETISILTKGKGSINLVKVPYQEARAKKDINKVIDDVNRLKSTFNNEKSFNNVLNYLTTGEIANTKTHHNTKNVTTQSNGRGDQTISPMIAIKEGMKVKSIITELRKHYGTIRPTQKPVKLIERLLSLVLPKKERDQIVVADFFGGSMSTMEACHNMGLNGIACEIDKEYFDAGKARIEGLNKQMSLAL